MADHLDTPSSTLERVLVIGSPGAGKSTLARGLRDALGLPLVYLDMIWHKPDGTNVTQAEFDERLAAALNGERWIIDGNYLRTLERRLERCDAVIFLDLPVEACLAGAAARIGQPREDLPWQEDALDPEFADYIRRFPIEQRPEVVRSARCVARPSPHHHAAQPCGGRCVPRPPARCEPHRKPEAPMTKTLYLIGGPMGVGKTTVCRELNRLLPASVMLDGDWCWCANPFQVTPETKRMVLDNICHLLGNFLCCDALRERCVLLGDARARNHRRDPGPLAPRGHRRTRARHLARRQRSGAARAHRAGHPRRRP